MKTPVAPRGSAQFNLRLPGDMRDRIQAQAKKNGRSMNTEMVALLKEALDGGKGSELRTIESKLDKVLAILEKQ